MSGVEILLGVLAAVALCALPGWLAYRYRMRQLRKWLKGGPQ